MLYQIFDRDFKQTPPLLDGKGVWFFPDMEDGREVIFWHLTHRDDKESGTRVPELQRCARLAWIRCVIEHSQEPEVLKWEYLEADGKRNTYLWLKDHDYLVLLRNMRSGSLRVITAHCIDFEGKRKSLDAKYKKRC